MWTLVWPCVYIQVCTSVHVRWINESHSHWTTALIIQIRTFVLRNVMFMGPGGLGWGGEESQNTGTTLLSQACYRNTQGGGGGQSEWGGDGWVDVGEWIRVLVVISGDRVEVGWVGGGERSMRCGHAMRHSEFETTVRAPAIKVKGLPLIR